MGTSIFQQLAFIHFKDTTSLLFIKLHNNQTDQQYCYLNNQPIVMQIIERKNSFGVYIVVLS